MMKVFKYTILVVFVSSSALAEDAPPTVTLTQDQLTRLIQAENAKAVGAYAAQTAQATAKDAYDAVQKAFASPQKPTKVQ